MKQTFTIVHLEKQSVEMFVFIWRVMFNKGPVFFSAAVYFYHEITEPEKH